MCKNEYQIMTTTERLTAFTRQKAYELGFQACGFSRARRLTEYESSFETWLKEGRHGTMSWMEKNYDKRLDPTILVDGARSVVSVLCSYHQPNLFNKLQSDKNAPRISAYALGDDYHKVLKDKLYQLFEAVREFNGGMEGRVFVDSAPVMDKAWAAQSGLGWYGKNSNLLNKKLGSFFFIGEMIVDTLFEYDKPVADHCGSCTRCIDACPTDAIYEPGKVDATKCISYLTIELRSSIPEEYHQAMGQWIYGCDICQDVCPWTRKAIAGNEPALTARDELLDKGIDFWEELDLHEYRKLFKNSAVKRNKLDGLKRNISVVSANLRK
jgi:epoxyqueuosine reductase